MGFLIKCVWEGMDKEGLRMDCFGHRPTAAAKDEVGCALVEYAHREPHRALQGT